MGCDYYIYSVLKIVHTNGVSLIKLLEEPIYLYGYKDDDFTAHPSKRRPDVDHMLPEVEDVLIYKKNINLNYDLKQYMELVEEFIKDNQLSDYNTQNKIL